MQFRDRIKELRRIPASHLQRNPKNWRKHPASQVEALRGLLSEIGFAGAELAFPADGLGPDGNFDDLMLIDGHARQDIAGDETVPVLITDLTADEADKVLATFDPIAAMAEADKLKLDYLLRDIQTGSDAVADMLTALAEENGIVPSDESETELKQIDVKPPPKMAWCLIGIPTVRYGEISSDMERIGAMPGVICETTANDG